ncbi:MAG: hypothetical protein U5K32_06185 [Bacteroidales bacterium]|nr:hypothetical protein [Bacteroidales bacterium]
MPDYSKHPLNRSYDLDTALSTIWEFYKKWFYSLFVISFVFSLITTYLSGKVNMSEIYSVTDPQEMMEILGSLIGPYALIILFTFTFTLILQYYVIIKPLEPESTIFSIASTAIIKFFLPLLILNIILGIVAVISIMLGFFIFIVGALFALVYIVMLAAFIGPVLMIEDNGIGDTINNSIKLAHKRFWPNIGWVAVFGILLIVVSFILNAVIMIPFGGSFMKTITNPDNAGEVLNIASRPSFILLSSLANAVTMPLFPIFSLVLYFNARSGAGNRVSSDKPGRNEGGKVKIEDLYAPRKDRKKELNKKPDKGPTIEDLMP